MIPFISNLFNLPVTKVEVLKRAKKYRFNGLCHAISKAHSDYKVDWISHSIIFPRFNRYEAIRFGAHRSNAYWWEPGDWKSGRMAFLNWLIEQYKDDKEDLRKIEL